MTKIDFLEAKFAVLFSAFEQLCGAVDQPDLAISTAEELGRLAALRHAGASIDGRALAWTAERRQTFTEKITASWAARHALKAETSGFFKFTYSDEPPQRLASAQAVATDCGLSLRAVSLKLTASPSGFAHRAGRHWAVYAKTEADLGPLLQAPALASGDADDTITLPKKRGGRF
jgi:hypothetical protein